MKKSILSTIFICAAAFSFAQSDKYERPMKANILQLDSVMQKNNFEGLANNFIRIDDVEKTKWLRYYYGHVAQQRKFCRKILKGKLCQTRQPIL